MIKQIACYTIEGNATPTARPRVVSKNGRTWAYSPKAEQMKKFRAELIEKTRGDMVSGPLEIDLIFDMQRPKSHYDSKGRIKPNRYNLPHTKKPDLDNLQKFVLDAMGGIVYEDDASVVQISCLKRYSNGIPKTIIEIFGWIEDL